MNGVIKTSGTEVARAIKVASDRGALFNQIDSALGKSQGYTSALVAAGKIPEVRSRHRGTRATLSQQEVDAIVASALAPTRTSLLVHEVTDQVIRHADETSLRTTIRRVVDEAGSVKSDVELARLLAFEEDGRWRSIGVHSIRHLLHQMKKAGEIDFRLQKQGRTQVILGITSAIRRYPVKTPPVQAIVEDTSTQPQDAVGDEIVQEPSDTSSPREWPLLSALRRREADAGEARARAERYIQAAALLDGLNEAQIVDALQAQAQAIAQTAMLSPLEAEYLAFAERCEAERLA